VIVYLFFTLGVIAMLRAAPAGAPQALWGVIGLLGFGVYGPQMLIGLCGAEIVSKKSVGASQVRLGAVVLRVGWTQVCCRLASKVSASPNL
jgi:OPA family sugar phosphate sensor protein UhpC-like MFS transporter